MGLVGVFKGLLRLSLWGWCVRPCSAPSCWSSLSHRLCGDWRRCYTVNLYKTINRHTGPGGHFKQCKLECAFRTGHCTALHCTAMYCSVLIWRTENYRFQLSLTSSYANEDME